MKLKLIVAMLLIAMLVVVGCSGDNPKAESLDDLMKQDSVVLSDGINKILENKKHIEKLIEDMNRIYNRLEEEVTRILSSPFYSSDVSYEYEKTDNVFSGSLSCSDFKVNESLSITIEKEKSELTITQNADNSSSSSFDGTVEINYFDGSKKIFQGKISKDKNENIVIDDNAKIDSETFKVDSIQVSNEEARKITYLKSLAYLGMSLDYGSGYHAMIMYSQHQDNVSYTNDSNLTAQFLTDGILLELNNYKYGSSAVNGRLLAKYDTYDGLPTINFDITNLEISNNTYSGKITLFFHIPLADSIKINGKEISYDLHDVSSDEAYGDFDSFLNDIMAEVIFNSSMDTSSLINKTIKVSNSFAVKYTEIDKQESRFLGTIWGSNINIPGYYDIESFITSIESGDMKTSVKSERDDYIFASESIFKNGKLVDLDNPIW